MSFILKFQNALIGAGLGLLVFLSFSGFLENGGLSYQDQGTFFVLSFFAAVLVMMVRPLADITGAIWLRRLVLLRKGFGILSASIIAGIMVSKILAPDSTYLSMMFSFQFFSFTNYAFFAHVGDITGFILLVTSNTFSQRLLKQNWKRIQRLSYPYFYAGGIYEAFALGNAFALGALILVTLVTAFAWWQKANRREQQSVHFAPTVIA